MTPVEVAVTTSRKICLGALALVLVGLAVDRLLVSSETLQPARAAASPLPSPVLAAAKAAPGAPAAATGSFASPQPARMAERLKALAAGPDHDPAAIREAFAPSDAWLALLTAPKEKDIKVDLAAEFARRHRLTSLLLAGPAGCAVVDGKVLRIGQQIDGFRLVGLAPDGAMFRSVREEAEAKLPLLTTSP
ncbi:MAG: hypothetical protein FJ288_09205 [Planctomycetes bacterium]|nr:hypothetical protein [Planctomycetota bacterium]